MTTSIIVTAYQPEWATQFAALHDKLYRPLEQYITRIEHVGSTSVVGLAAKPIIDIDIIVRSFEVLPDVIEELATLGYSHRGNLGIEGREAFGHSHSPKHNLYVCLDGCDALRNHLTLRDHLRAHPNDRDAYGALKQHLALAHPDDIDAYLDGKTTFIIDILSQYNMSEDALDEIERINRKA